MSEVSSPRKPFSFFLPGNRIGHGTRNRPKPIPAISGGFTNYNMPPEASTKEESDISSTIENPLQKMTFRVLNPDPETSSSESNKDDDHSDDDHSEYEVIRPAPSSIIQEEKTTVPEEDEVDGHTNNLATPAITAPVLRVPPTTPPTTESSHSSPDMRQEPPTGTIPGLYAGMGWKVSNGSELKTKRQSKIMVEEEEVENESGERSPTENPPAAGMDSLRRRSDDDDSSFLSPRMQPLSPPLPQQRPIFADKRRLRDQPRNIRSRPQQQQQSSYPQISIPPTPLHGTFTSPGSSPHVGSPTPRASFMVSSLGPAATATATATTSTNTTAVAASPSKYNKASYSLTNHPDAIKIYRTMAEKTRDPLVQLTYAKYLLEIAELYDVAEDGGRSHRFSALVQDYNISSNMYGHTRSVDNGGIGSDDGMPSSVSRLSMESIISAPLTAVSSHRPSTIAGAAVSTNPPSTRPARRPISEENRRKKKILEDEGIRWIKLLSKQNVGEAAYMMAEWHQHGLHGVSKNSTKAFRFYKAAAAELVPEAMYEVAKAYERSGYTAQALSNYRGAADKGVAEAIYRIARIHLIGELGQRRNVQLGLTLLAQAAELATEKCPEPPYLLGLVLTNAHPKLDIPMETIHQFGGEVAAMRYFERAAQLGYGHAQTRIAFVYEHGLYGTPVNFAKSFAYYEVAAQESNHPQAMLGLSRLYNHGCRGPNDVLTDTERVARDVSGWLAATMRDEDAAFSWCRKAADQGLIDAIYLLGWYYETGVGVLRDYERASQLYTRAAAKGHTGAADRLLQTNSVTRQQHQDTKRDFRTSDSKFTNCILM